MRRVRLSVLLLLIPAAALIGAGCESAPDPPGPAISVIESTPPPVNTDGPPVVAGQGPPGKRVPLKDADPLPRTP